MSEELVYKMRVTKSGKTELWRLCLPYKMILESVQEQYDWGAEAVELEWMPNITREQFHDQLPKDGNSISKLSRLTSRQKTI